MSGDHPPIFNITVRLKKKYDAISGSITDKPHVRDLSIKVLQYLLRCHLSDIRLYTKPSPNFEVNSSMEETRMNFARLFKQCDLLSLLPSNELGIVRHTYALVPFPLPQTTRSATAAMFSRQIETVTEVVSSASPNFAIYTSSFGISQTISLPTISVLLPQFDPQLLSRLRSFFDPFDYECYAIRFVLGGVKPAGRIYHYPRVPPGASISDNEKAQCLNPSCVCYNNPPPFASQEERKVWEEEFQRVTQGRAGTLGCYCYLGSDRTARYALTAGHVVDPVSPHHTPQILAPASRPFNEAIVSTNADLKLKLKANANATAQQSKVDALANLDRAFGDTVLYSTATDSSPPYRKLDYALIRVNNERHADNRLDKLDAYRTEFEFEEGGKRPVNIENPLQYGEIVYKLGIRTGFTKGAAIDDVKLKWNAHTTNPISPKDPLYNLLPTSHAYAIMGIDDDRAPVTFAEPGDSGSLIVRLTQYPTNEVSKSEAVGILYGILYEEPRDVWVSLYIPLRDVDNLVFSATGKRIDISVDDVGVEGEVWGYTELGRGRSRNDLK
jgi:hypothetical protein